MSFTPYSPARSVTLEMNAQLGCLGKEPNEDECLIRSSFKCNQDSGFAEVSGSLTNTLPICGTPKQSPRRNVLPATPVNIPQSCCDIPLYSTGAATPRSRLLKTRRANIPLFDSALASPAPFCVWEASSESCKNTEAATPDNCNIIPGICTSDLCMGKLAAHLSPIESYGSPNTDGSSKSAVKNKNLFMGCSRMLSDAGISRCMWDDHEDSGVSGMKSCISSSSDDSCKKTQPREDDFLKVRRSRRLTCSRNKNEIPSAAKGFDDFEEHFGSDMEWRYTSTKAVPNLADDESYKASLRGRFRRMQLRDRGVINNTSIAFASGKSSSNESIADGLCSPVRLSYDDLHQNNEEDDISCQLPNLRSMSSVSRSSRKLSVAVTPYNNKNNLSCATTYNRHAEVSFDRLLDTPKCQTGMKLDLTEADNSLKLKRSMKTAERLMSASEKSSRSHDEGHGTLDYEPQYNVNPFTLSSKRSVSKDDDDSNDGFCGLDKSDQPARKRLALNQLSTSRYNEEFLAVREIGSGQFGRVTECVHRLDGCTYAIKCSRNPIARSGFRGSALNEIYAYAALGLHENIVRYYTSWVERKHVFLQTEYCNGGSLEGWIEERRKMEDKSASAFKEKELRRVLMGISSALDYMHSRDMVHLDVKPENILIHRDLPFNPSARSNDTKRSPDNKSTTTFCIEAYPVTYKLGDLGHVRLISTKSIEEGDCRYLPQEVIQDRLGDLPKADIYSLALTIYEMGSLEEMPKNGALWQRYREVGLPDLSSYSTQLNIILKSMSNKNPSTRPAAKDVHTYVQSSTPDQDLPSSTSSLPVQPKSWLCSTDTSSNKAEELLLAALQQELNQVKNRNSALLLELSECKADKSLDSATGPTNKKNKVIGRGCKKSRSLAIF